MYRRTALNGLLAGHWARAFAVVRFTEYSAQFAEALAKAKALGLRVVWLQQKKPLSPGWLRSTGFEDVAALDHDPPRTSGPFAARDGIIQSLNVVDGATHIEVMVPDAGPIELIDFNLRFAGIRAIALASDAFGVPFARYLADLACGKEPELSRLAQPSGRNNQIDSVAWSAVTGDSAAEAHRKALSARAETVFKGAPVGDDPPLICPRHLPADVAVS